MTWTHTHTLVVRTGTGQIDVPLCQGPAGETGREYTTPHGEPVVYVHPDGRYWINPRYTSGRWQLKSKDGQDVEDAI